MRRLTPLGQADRSLFDIRDNRLGGTMRALAGILVFATSLASSAAASANPEATTAASPTEAPPASPIAEISTENAVLRAGTPVALRLMEEITTKHKSARVGQRFTLEVADAVQVDGVNVIPVGTPAWGEITGVRNKGMWGKSGKLDARLLYLRVNGRQIRLTGSFDEKGVTGTVGVVSAVAFVPIAGFFTTGTSATFPKGEAINGFIDEDVALAFKRSAPARLQVPVAPVPVQILPPTAANPAPTDSTPSPQN